MLSTLFSMSLGGPKSTALEAAIKAAVQAGVTYIVAAGNDNNDACNV
jgi:subtilisin family serine protease